MFRLPRADVTRPRVWVAHTTTLCDASVATTAREPVTEPVRILILEDNPLDAELVVRQLRQGELDATHRVVATERDFRSAVADFAPHVIISDFSLPEFDGLTAMQIAAAVAPGTPFIFVSGTIGEERAIDALKRGA